MHMPASFERLSPAHQAVAGRLLDFVARADARYFGRVAGLNGGGADPETRDLLACETDDSLYDVRVLRGPVVEKFGRMLVEGRKTQPGRREGELAWGRFYSLDVHPATPLVGMLHATLVLQFYADGTGFAGGWLGVMNGTRVDEDMAGLGRLVDDWFAARGRDPATYRQLMVKGTDETVGRFRRRPDPCGVSFYGPPVFRGDVAASYEFVEGLFERFTDGYLDLIPRRAADVPTEEDRQRQDEMRRRWLVDQFLSDPFSSKLVPFEAWSLANVPPVIRF